MGGAWLCLVSSVRKKKRAAEPGGYLVPQSESASEDELRRKLHGSRAARERNFGVKEVRRARDEIILLRTRSRRNRVDLIQTARHELRVVEGVQELAGDLQLVPLGHAEALQHVDVPVVDRRKLHGVAARVRQGPGARPNKVRGRILFDVADDRA